MDSILPMMGVAATLVAAGVVGAARQTLRMTTLMTAWRWSVAAVVLWLVAGILSWGGGGSDALRELAWFTAALLALCPPIAVLGARRPGAGAWTWFVLVPLLAVLGWPAMMIWEAGVPSRSLRLELPHMIGIGLVLLMGAGNYIGARYWAPAGGYAVAVCLVIAPLSESSPEWLTRFPARPVGSCVLGLSAALACWTASRRSQIPPSLEKLYEDYRNTFGVVWARRLQDRLNAVALQQHWPVRATPDGFHWDSDVSPAARNEAAAKVEQSLRWMLRRFVSPDWIDERLGRK